MKEKQFANEKDTQIFSLRVAVPSPQERKGREGKATRRLPNIMLAHFVSPRYGVIPVPLSEFKFMHLYVKIQPAKMKEFVVTLRKNRSKIVKCLNTNGFRLLSNTKLNKCKPPDRSSGWPRLKF